MNSTALMVGAGAALLVLSKKGGDGSAARTVRTTRDNFAKWFGVHAGGVPKTPIPQVYDILIVGYLFEVSGIAQERSDINTDEEHAAFDEARARYKSEVNPLLVSWSNAGKPDEGWGNGPFLSASDAATLWTETERLADAIDRVHAAKPDVFDVGDAIGDVVGGVAGAIGDVAGGVAGGLVKGLAPILIPVGIVVALVLLWRK